MDKLFSSWDDVERVSRDIERVGIAIENMLKPINFSILEFHRFYMALDPKYARKYRHRKRYLRIYAGGKKHNG